MDHQDGQDLDLIQNILYILLINVNKQIMKLEPKTQNPAHHPQQMYWDTISDDYQELTTIKTSDFHFGPLLPGNSDLNILPEVKKGTTCLELGCGGAQNSIFLAKQGAICTAVDISQKQIQHAEQLAAKHKVKIALSCFPLEDFSAWPTKSMTNSHCATQRVAQTKSVPISERHNDVQRASSNNIKSPQTKQQFDLVHSVYTLPFIENPEAFIKNAANHVSVGGTFLLVTKHPVFCAEWLELEDEEMGSFLPSYFEPPDDIRENTDGDLIISRAYPISTVSNWIHRAGLQNLQIWEPQPLPLEEINNAPYHSPAWIELHPNLSTSPVSIIYLAQKQ